MDTTSARSTGHSAARTLVLVGWGAKAVVYLALAWLVLQLAFGSAPQQPTATGALQYIAQTGPGSLAIVLVGLGLLAHAVGRVLEVTLMARPQVDGKDKAEAGVLAVVYASLALSALALVGLAGRTSGSSGSSTEQQGSAFLLGLPGGRWLVGLAGLVLAAFGVYQAYQGAQKAFLGTLRTQDMSHGMREAVAKIGMVAYATRGAVFVLLAWFLVQSAVTYDASKARGLDGALQEVAQQSWGRVVLTLVAVGLFAYAAFNAIEARYRELGVSASGTD